MEGNTLEISFHVDVLERALNTLAEQPEGLRMALDNPRQVPRAFRRAENTLREPKAPELVPDPSPKFLNVCPFSSLAAQLPAWLPAALPNGISGILFFHKGSFLASQLPSIPADSPCAA